MKKADNRQADSDCVAEASTHNKRGLPLHSYSGVEKGDMGMLREHKDERDDTSLV